MTILLTKDLRVGGVLLASGTTQTFGADLEADIVARQGATYLTDPTPGKTVPVVATTNLTGGIELFAAGQSLGSAGSTYTWATKPLASVLRGQIFISDIGVGGSYWYSDGSKWRPVGGRVTLKNTITNIQNTGAAKVVMDYATLPAGLVSDGDLLEVSWNHEKVGVSDTCATDLAIGTVAGTAGTSLAVATSGLAGATLTLATRHLLRKESSTSIRPLTLAIGAGVGTSTNTGVVITVPDMNSQVTYLQNTSDMTAGTDVVNLRGFVVILVCGS